MLSLVLVLAPSTWMMLLVLQMLISYWNALADKFWHITVIIMLMLVWVVKVLLLNLIIKKQKDRSIIYIYYYFSSMRNWSTATSRR